MNSPHDSRAELERIAGDPAARAAWEEERRIEDALEPAGVPGTLHARIMARVQSDGTPAWARGGRRAPRGIGLPIWALGAAAVLFIIVAGVEGRRSLSEDESRRNAIASLERNPPIRIRIPSAVADVARPGNLAAEGREVTEFAQSIVNSAVSPLRALPVPMGDQSGGNSSMIERDRSS